MARLSTLILVFLLLPLLLPAGAASQGTHVTLKASAKTWCVANPLLSIDTFRNAESYVCNDMDCSSIENSADPCFVSSNMVYRASIFINANYKKHHDCIGSGVGLKAITDPSYEKCTFDGLKTSDEIISESEAVGKWCIAKPNTPYSMLERNFESSCSQVDCSEIPTGGGYPSEHTIRCKAYMAMNLRYQASKRTDLSCYFMGTGMIVIDDPGFGTYCSYEGGDAIPANVVVKHGGFNKNIRKAGKIVMSVVGLGGGISITIYCCGRRKRGSSEGNIQMQTTDRV